MKTVRISVTLLFFGSCLVWSLKATEKMWPRTHKKKQRLVAMRDREQTREDRK